MHLGTIDKFNQVGAMLSEGGVIIGSSSNSNSNFIRVSLIDNSSEIQVVGSNEQFDITLFLDEWAKS